MLKTAYRKSGLTAADLATATGLGVATVHIAMNGFRHRNGEARVAIPPDRTLVRLAAVLRIHPDVLRAHDRGRAADLLAEAGSAQREGHELPVTLPSDISTQSSAVGRQGLVRQILAAFSTEELRCELERRDRAEHDELDREGKADAAADLKANLGVF